MSKAALVGLVLACASTGAYATPIDIIDFEDVTPGLYSAPSSFGTTANLGAGNPYTFNVNAGTGIVDTGTGPFATGGSGCSTGQCSNNGTQALYVFSSGAVMLQSALSNYVMTLTSFDAAIASINPSPFPGFPSFTQATLILVTGQIHGGGSISQLFPLLPPGNESFQTQILGAGFTNLDSATFAFTIDTSLITDPLILAAINDAGLSDDFAIDNIVATSTPAQSNPPPPPPPNNVPEPGTLGLLMTGLIGLGMTRRRRQRSA
jgi:hypothetical protein